MPESVRLNVYELIPSDSKAQTLGKDAMDVIGMGIFHSGVEILGEEISFGMDPTGRNDPQTDGVFIVMPHSAMGNFRESIELGQVNIDEYGVAEILEKLRPQWRAASYHLLGHNCNCFTYAFIEALGGQALLANYPKWLNRAASVGHKVIPEALLRTVTSAVAPPAAVPPDLINKLFVPVSGPVPRPLPPCGPTPAQVREAAAASKGGGVFGFAKGLAAKAESAVRGVIDDKDRQKLTKAFPDISPDTLLCHYPVRVLHINREQPADLFVTTKGLAFSGINKLSVVFPYTAIVCLQYGLKKESEQLNIPPTFEVSATAEGSNAVLVYLAELGMMPIFAIGGVASKAVTKTIGKVVGSTTHAQDLMPYIDTEWRKNVKV